MNKNKNLAIDKAFNLAVKNHLEGKINIAQDLYNQVLEINPNHANASYNLAVLLDELIINDNWEEDEFKALNEFCDNLGYSYEVIAISFFSKQVAVKIKKK